MEAATTKPPCMTLILEPTARRDVHANLYDRVRVLPGRLDYALVPSSVYARLGLRGSPPSPTKASSPPAPQPESITAASSQDNEPETLYVTVDETLEYARFFADFGPLDLGQTVHFCRTMEQHLAAHKQVLLVSSEHPHKRANAVTLLALFLVIVHKASPVQAINPFRSLRPVQGFRDAACGLCTFFVTVYDCASAVYKAIQESILDYVTFRLDEYEHYDKLHHGDINWIVPGKVLAFSGPQRERVVLDGSGCSTLLAHEYAKVFTTLGVSCVVRFNEPTTYDRRAFVHASIRHLDMHYPDGGNPSDEIMFKFIRTCERESGAVAVHCKAGLGRTGTNIAAYLMKRHRFSAVEAIAWCRLCRPGSIVGPQQQFLVVKQPQIWQLAASERDDAQKRQQATAKDAGVGGTAAATVKKQSFAAMRERLPIASTAMTNMPAKKALRRRASLPAAGNSLVTAAKATTKPVGLLR